MKRHGIWLAVLIATIAGFEACKRHQQVPQETSASVVYQCPMHPQIIRDEPGLCPICHMELKPVDRGHEAHEVGVVGRVPFKVSARRQQLIGVTYGTVETRDLERVIHASGRVAYDPGLYSAIEEYRQAVQTEESIPQGSSSEARSLTESIVRSTNMKLRLLGLSEAQITALSKKPDSSSNDLLLGRSGGKVWVYAEVYEYEMNLVKSGQVMEITSPALPGETFSAKVLSIDPIVNPVTRTARVRGEVENPQNKLKPEMYLQVSIRVPLGRQLSVPIDAVVDTGEHEIVFVSHEDGTLEPRDARLGPEVEDYYIVLSGLSEGDNVVASANFLIDSESQFHAAAQSFMPEMKSGKGMEDMPNMPGMQH